MTARRRPTRRDLLIVVGRLQNLVGDALIAAMNDRGPSQMDHLLVPLNQAILLCIQARSYDPPICRRSDP